MSVEVRYALCFSDEPGRCLCSLGASHINFNITGIKTFSTALEAEVFRQHHSSHFFNLGSLVIVEHKAR